MKRIIEMETNSRVKSNDFGEMAKREDLIKSWGIAWSDYVNKSCLLTSAYGDLIFYSWKYFIRFGNDAVPANVLPIRFTI